MFKFCTLCKCPFPNLSGFREVDLFKSYTLFECRRADGWLLESVNEESVQEHGGRRARRQRERRAGPHRSRQRPPLQHRGAALQVRGT